MVQFHKSLPKDKKLLLLTFIIPLLLLVLLAMPGFGAKPQGFQDALLPFSLAGFNLQPEEDILLDVPLFTQTKNLSCEAAAIKMVLAYYGQSVDEDEIQRSFPRNANPHRGFRGDVDGKIWGFEDYGVYPGPVAGVLKRYGLEAKAYKNLTEKDLKKQLREGKPAIIWVNIANPHPEIRYVNINEDLVKLVAGEHVAVVIGYQHGQWILNDPWRRTDKDTNKISETIRVNGLDDIYWNWFDHMGVLII